MAPAQKFANRRATGFAVVAGEIIDIHPDEFAEYREIGYQLGLDYVESGPLVRSSYHSERHVFAGLGRKEWERSR